MELYFGCQKPNASSKGSRIAISNPHVAAQPNASCQPLALAPTARESANSLEGTEESKDLTTDVANAGLPFSHVLALPLDELFISMTEQSLARWNKDHWSDRPGPPAFSP